MTDDERNKKADEILSNIAKVQIEFSGATAERAEWHEDWLRFADRPWYNLMRSVLINNGIGEGDAEMILANAWEDGWIRGAEYDQN